MKDWISCTACDEEFRVITESLESISYCPFCSEPIEEEYDEDEDE